MIRATSRLSRVNLATAIAAGLLCAPAAPAAAAPDHYLKLGSVEGESADDKHKSEIEIQSWSWGATQMGTGGHGGATGAGKANVQDISLATHDKADAPAEEVGRKSIGAPKIGEASAREGAPAAVSHDLRTNVVARTAPAPDSRGVVTGVTPGTTGIKVAAGDIDGDGRADVVSPRDAASGIATGKRQHRPVLSKVEGPVTMTMGSLSLDVPAGMCRAGARYPSAEFGTPQRVFTLDDVIVTSCTASAASGSDRPMESLSLNYGRVR